MKPKKFIKTIAVVAASIVFFSAFLAPLGGYGAVAFAAEPEFTVVNTGAVSDSGSKPSISNNIIAFRISESNLGIDLDGDSYIEDAVLGYYDLSNSKVVYTSTYCQSLSPKVSDNFITFIQMENAAKRDLSGDGDFNDYVPVVFDVLTGELISTRSPFFSAEFIPNISGDKMACPIYESGAGKDLNGDNDTVDDILTYFDISSQTIVNLKKQVLGTPPISNKLIAFPTGLYLSYFDFQTQEIIDTQIKHAFGSLAVYNDKIAFITGESSLGEDLNGDGDTSDYIIRYYDTTRKQVFNTGAEVTRFAYPTISGNIIAFVTSEAIVGPLGEDLNGDGDKLDDIVRYYNISTGRVVNTKAETIPTLPAVSEKIIAFLTYEWSVGSSGIDLNGDGDKFDRIVRYYDISSGTIGSTGEKANEDTLNVSNNIIAFSIVETAIGRNGVDVNGDGDKSDNIVRYVAVGKLPAFPPLASFTAAPTSGLAPLTVNFNDTSTNNPASWKWDFDNDGVIDSAVQNPSHTYNTAGTYAVSLTVSNIAGSDTKTAPNLITVTAPDITPPAVFITEPLDNATVRGAITIKANASDNKGVNRVEFYIDNTLHSADNTSPYEYSWDTTTVSDGLYSIKAKAYDDAGNSAQDSITVAVHNLPEPNQAPVLALIGNRSVQEDQVISFTVIATDADTDSLSLSLQNPPPGASFQDNHNNSAAFFWRPGFTQAGSYSVSFTVDDLRGGTDSEAITITVSNVNQAPILGPIGNQSVKEGELLSFRITGSDPDRDALSFFGANLPPGAGFNPLTQTFSWRPTKDDAGIYPNIRFAVSDGSLTVSEDITIMVIDVPDEPSSEELSLQSNLIRRNCKLTLELIARSNQQPDSKLSYRLKDNAWRTLKTGQLFFKRSQGYYSKLLQNLPLSSYIIEVESDKGARASQEIDPFNQPDTLSFKLISKPQGRRIQIGLEVSTTPFHSDNCLHYSLRDKSGSRLISQGNLSYKRSKGIYAKTLSLVPGAYQLLLETNYGGRLEQEVKVE